jgi:tricorn protease
LKTYAALLCSWLVLAVTASAKEPIRLANHPALSPDGSTLAFDWNGDIWTVPVAGGVARQLTYHPGRDHTPKFSPDGKEIAFTSERGGSPQVYVMPAQGGTPLQLTFHTAGCTVEDWYPDGQALLIRASRDHFWRHADRFFRIGRQGRAAEELLFDDYGKDGVLAPDDRQLLFCREGPAWWRKGYHGSQASQVWRHDGQHSQKLLDDPRGACWPLWKPDGRGFYYVGGQGGSFNLWEQTLPKGQARQLTRFTDDSVVFPCISRDGSTIVFRHLFDFYRLRPGGSEPPAKIDVWAEGDRTAERTQRRVLQQATAVTFSADGLEIAFIAGGDLWVMDTELREPKQVTRTAEEERHPVFSPDGESILFVSDKEGQCDIWRARRADPKKYWWQNDRFELERLTNDDATESALKFSPDGRQVAFVKGRGDLWVMAPDGKDARCLQAGWDTPEFDWSPDGRWIAHARYDNDFNRDIWVLPLDGSREPFNISRHPNNEGNPVWSPDGKVIAFTGQRGGTEVDIYYVWLQAEDDERTSRERSLEKALDKMKKGRTATPRTFPPVSDKSEVTDTAAKKAAGEDKQATPRKPAPPKVTIDFDRLPERIRHISIPESKESNLFWSPDSRKLAFTATVEGKRGTYTVEIPDDTRPKLLSSQTGTQAQWLRNNQIVWLSNGLPGSISATGTPAPTTPAAAPTPSRAGMGRFNRGTPPATPPTAPAAPAAESGAASTGGGYRFQALQQVDLPEKNAAVFDLCWRTMRDNFYDERLGNRDWNAVRQKYRDMAAAAPDAETLGTVVNLMLGELNGSHLGFTPGARTDPRADPTQPAPTEPTGPRWNVVTAHLGLRFDPAHKGPGLKVRDVIPGGPADTRRSKVEAGEVVVIIDGAAVDPSVDLTKVLNGPLPRDVQLVVRSADGKERGVAVRPIRYEEARRLLYEKWVQDNRRLAEKLSDGKLGYLHISAMAMPSFYRFEQELYAVGHGKDGLIIDVRENGGGSTADHLLTALSQPVHAITVPRGGGPGYPQDRKVYATWNKPIVVLCNQNSFSNAEIFSHAIKTLGRGQLVGVPTAGGVISTGGTAIMDAGFLRLPFRGWFVLNTGEDMELNGAVPQHIVWPEPGQMPAGKDVQLEKAVEVLLADVKAWQERPRPALRKATERRSKE